MFILPCLSSGNLKGGKKWWKLEVEELQAYMGICILMGVKTMPNHRAYWQLSKPFLYCRVVALCMSRDRFERITSCLHVDDDRGLSLNREDPHRDKLCKVRWLLTEIRKRYMENWNLGQMITIDEMIVRYKGKYCPIWQYMPKKPCKWGIKI